MRNILTIYRRELFSYFTSPIAYIFMILFVGVLSFYFFKFHPFFLVGEADMRPFFDFVPWLLLIFGAAITMRLWSEEYRVGTAELLLTLPYRAWEVIFGKFFAAYSIVALALVATFGIPIAVGWAGDPDWGPIITGYVSSFLVGGLFIALGGFASSLTENQVVALLVSIMGGFAFLMIFGERVAMFVAGDNHLMAQIIQSIGVNYHIQSFARGVLALSDLVYFLTLIAFFVALNIFSVQRKRY